MGRGEQPSLMMDPANCSPVQVSGTWYLLPKMKKKNNNPQLLPHPFLMAVVCLCIRCNSEGGSIIHLQSRRDAGSGCVPALSPPLSSWDRGVGDASGCLCPSSEIPKGATAAAYPRSARRQTRAQMFHPGAVWRLVARCYLSWCPSDCRCWQKSRLAAQDKSDINTLFISADTCPRE